MATTGDFSGESMALAIKEAGLTKSEVARRMGVTPQTVNDYIKRNPTIDTWNKFYLAIGKEPIKSYFENINPPIPSILKEEEEIYKPNRSYDLVSQLRELAVLYKEELLSLEEYNKAKDITIKKFAD